MSTDTKFSLPTVFVLFGITGDLVRRKILLSLYSLYCKNLLPEKLQIYGFSRRDFDDESLRNYLRTIMQESSFGKKDKYEEFLNKFYYVRGNFTECSGYEELAGKLGHLNDEWRVCANKLFYLAVPPKYYKSILNNLSDTDLTEPCSSKEGFTRVVLEKPFGRDLQTARSLDELLGKLFKEEQIYRVDHYLGKETVRNILAFRFSNSFLSPSWNNTHIEKIEVKMAEKLQVEKRGEFYDAVGALRDVGQNHVLQLLALFTMETPESFDADRVRVKRAESLKQLKNLSYDDVLAHTVRGQYEGYRNEEGVESDSQTETYFHIKTTFSGGAVKGVPIYLESGKALDSDRKEVLITFKHEEPCLCPTGQHYENVLRYTITPTEKIAIQFMVKKPGYTYELVKKDFGFDYSEEYSQQEFIPPYEQLLLDIVRGDQTLFVSTDEILTQWSFVEPILQTWRKGNPELMEYAPGSRPQDGFK